MRDLFIYLLGCSEQDERDQLRENYMKERTVFDSPSPEWYKVDGTKTNDSNSKNYMLPEVW